MEIAKNIEQSKFSRRSIANVDNRMEKLSDNLEKRMGADNDRGNGDVSGILEQRKRKTSETCFHGMTEGNRLVAEAAVHESRGREYERRANSLEASIRTKKIPESSRSEVDSLKRRASEEYAQAARLKSDARREFSSGY